MWPPLNSHRVSTSRVWLLFPFPTLFSASFAALCSASRVRIGSIVVLVVVDLAALVILLMLDVVVLGASQMAAICCAVVACFVVDVGFVVFDVGGFTPRHLPGMNSLIDTILLAILARVHAHSFGVSRSPMVNRRIIAAVNAGGLLVRDLTRRSAKMLLARIAAFFGCGPRTDAAFAVEADATALASVNKAAILVNAVEAGAHVPRR